MLRLKNIVKVYNTGSYEVKALKGVNLSFRKNEFVSILGPSGCGKTTLLNIIGGLDKYTSGDLIIGNKSTKEFKDKDWDSYRNHKIGFIFQSYNLIPHQTILANVELALTISGISKEERIKRAKEALDKVGLKDQYNKKPNQLSGGQCQRVAIARALVNKPDILLADEPTGALDTETSIQIMELIKEISKEKLVIMVTHNPDLAVKYSTRIVNILDGNIIDDSNPFTEEEEINEVKDLEPTDFGKAKMSWWTAFKLSSLNLWSKFKRTILTCIAGSIGIVGICSVLAVSSGVKGYIYDMQDEMLSGNPITISETSYDLQAIMGDMSAGEKAEAIIKNGIVNVDSLIKYISSLIDEEKGMLINNEINKDYVQYIDDMPTEYYSAISKEYGVNLSNNIYTTYKDPYYVLENEKYIKKEREREVSVSGITSIYTSVLKESQFGDYAQFITSLATPLMQSLPDEDYILSQYDIKAGRVATNKEDLMIVVNSKQELVDLVLAQLGYYSQDEFIDMAVNYDKDNYGKLEFSFEELMNKKFTYYPNNEIYGFVDFETISNKIPAFIEQVDKSPLDPTQKQAIKVQLNNLYSFLHGATPYTYRSVNQKFDSSILVKYLIASGMQESMAQVIIKALGEDLPSYQKFNNGLELNVVGILMPKEGRLYSSLKTGVYYTEDLVQYSIEQNMNSDIINYAKEKMAENDSETFVFGVQDQTKNLKQHIPHFFEYTPDIREDVNNINSNPVGLGMSILTPSSGSSMTDMINTVMGGNATALGPDMRELGGNDIPNMIKFYPVTFEEKYLVTDYLDKWNSDEDITLSNNVTLTKDGRTNITYQDNLELIITMINGMIDMVTIALVCFTALSLVVSCVMIAIITYVSVMERIKEIGIIRSLGGRKRDVSNLFNAETILIGTFSGLLGIAISYILSITVSLIIKNLFGIYPISDLQWYQALIMLLISVVLTTISGFVPAHSASKKDPVVALRTE